jgi:hypothetical protein
VLLGNRRISWRTRMPDLPNDRTPTQLRNSIALEQFAHHRFVRYVRSLLRLETRESTETIGVLSRALAVATKRALKKAEKK